jgi:hypothetical protein
VDKGRGGEGKGAREKGNMRKSKKEMGREGAVDGVGMGMGEWGMGMGNEEWGMGTANDKWQMGMNFKQFWLLNYSIIHLYYLCQWYVQNPIHTLEAPPRSTVYSYITMEKSVSHNEMRILINTNHSRGLYE